MKRIWIAALLALAMLFAAAQATAEEAADSGAEAAVAYGSRAMKKDSRGEDVRLLQEYLREIGLYTGSVTGNYGALTLAAVKKFQRQNGLAADGIAGPKTLQALLDRVNERRGVKAQPAEEPARPARVIRKGAQGDDVLQLQKDLQALGFYRGSLTGSCGSQTASAIRRFQLENRLKADGAAGAQTLGCIAERLRELGEADGAPAPDGPR